MVLVNIHGHRWPRGDRRVRENGSGSFGVQLQSEPGTEDGKAKTFETGGAVASAVLVNMVDDAGREGGVGVKRERVQGSLTAIMAAGGNFVDVGSAFDGALEAVAVHEFVEDDFNSDVEKAWVKVRGNLGERGGLPT